jgi:hypothetical protein
MSRFGPAALAALLALACGPGGQQPGTCTTSEQCPAETLCRAGSCVASAPPVAELGAPGAELLYSHRIIEIDSAALDPDGEDRVTRWAWRATPVDAPCAAEIVEGDGPVLKLWAGCAGSFDVELVVTDSAGVESAPAVKRIALAAEPNPVQLLVPGIIERHHRCSGSPPRCATVEEDGTGSIPLIAGWEQEEGRVEVEWSCEAPEGSAARLTLSNAAIPNPRLTIETDGTAIAGDYRCTATGTDTRRTTDRTDVTVRVLNRAPEVRMDVPGLFTIAVNHVYDPGARVFRAAGSTPRIEIVDPDGDPLVAATPENGLGWTALHGGDDDSSFAVVADEGHAEFLIEVPDHAPGQLIGDGVLRRVGHVAEDIHGARSQVVWDVQVSNREPPAAPLSGASDHAYDPRTATYTATVPLSAIDDPDGDPVEVLGTDDATCAVAWRGGDRRVYVRCGSRGETLEEFVAPRRFAVVLRDPWARVVTSAALQIRNRPPAIVGATIPVPVTLQPCPLGLRTIGGIGGVFGGIGGLQIRSTAMHAGGAVTMSPTVSDPDGDPLVVSASWSGTASVAPRARACAVRAPPECSATSPVESCIGTSSCPLEWRLGPMSCTTSLLAQPSREVDVQVSDGVSAAIARFTVASQGG